jgi:hypothetical protein
MHEINMSDPQAEPDNHRIKAVRRLMLAESHIWTVHSRHIPHALLRGALLEGDSTYRQQPPIIVSSTSSATGLK